MSSGRTKFWAGRTTPRYGLPGRRLNSAGHVAGHRPTRNRDREVLETPLPRPESYLVAVQRFPRMGYYARITVTVVVVLGLISAAWAVRNILLLVLVAAVLAVGLDPPVRRLQRMRITRGTAVLLLFLAAIGFLVAFGMLVIPPLVREVKQLSSDIPGYISRLQHDQGWVGDLE